MDTLGMKLGTEERGGWLGRCGGGLDGEWPVDKLRVHREFNLYLVLGTGLGDLQESAKACEQIGRAHV